MEQKTGVLLLKVYLAELVNNVAKDGTIISILTSGSRDGLMRKMKPLLKLIRSKHIFIKGG